MSKKKKAKTDAGRADNWSITPEPELPNHSAGEATNYQYGGSEEFIGTSILLSGVPEESLAESVIRSSGERIAGIMDKITKQWPEAIAGLARGSKLENTESVKIESVLPQDKAVPRQYVYEAMPEAAKLPIDEIVKAPLSSVPEQISEPLAEVAAGPSLKGHYEKIFYNGKDMACLKRGSDQTEAVKFLQSELKEVGLGKGIKESDLGKMNGLQTVSEISALQKLMHGAGAQIKVEEPSKAVAFNETWSALRALREFGGVDALTDADKAKQVVARYEEIKSSNVQEMLALKKDQPNQGIVAVDPRILQEKAGQKLGV